jgi:hypothetical protein
MKVAICAHCQQAFSTTAAGLELLFAHLIREHHLSTEAAGDEVDTAKVIERDDLLPVPLPRCR